MTIASLMPAVALNQPLPGDGVGGLGFLSGWRIEFLANSITSFYDLSVPEHCPLPPKCP